MSQIEDIFLDVDFSLNQSMPRNRVKMGEVFQLPNERYALVCIHCSEEFQYFSEFTLHVQEHFQRLKPMLASEMIKTEAEIDESISRVEPQELEVLDLPKLTVDGTDDRVKDTISEKVENNYSDDDFNDFLDVCVNNDSDIDDEEVVKQPPLIDKIAKIVLEPIVITKPTKVKVAPKTKTKAKTANRPTIKQPKAKRIKLESQAVSNRYEDMLAKFLDTNDDPMDPIKFEIFKAEKVDGLFPCTIKDTPEVRMISTFSVHSYKYDKRDKDYLCPVCMSAFPNPTSVRRHLFTHIKEPVFLCGFCPEKFRALRYLRDHLKQKHGTESRSFECFMCHQVFQNHQFRWLRDHIQTHQIGNLHCMLCNKKFKEYRFYQLHMMNIHPNGIDLKAETSAPAEPIDYREKPVISSYECYLCRKDFRERRLLRSHMKLHVQQPRLCLVCGIFCSSATSLSRHMKLHDSDETKSHLCTICGKGFKIRQYLLRHNRKDHQLWADNTPPVCTICGAYFDKKSLLHEHMKTHPFEETRNFICTICNHAARNAYNLKRHMETHSNDRSYECPICQKTFNPRYAKDHMKSHTEARKHKCPDCGKKFKRKYALKQHMYQHGGAPEHVCDICGRAFARTDKLLRHRRRHGIPLNYHCKICLKGFISQKSYQLHESSHMKSETPLAPSDAMKLEIHN